MDKNVQKVRAWWRTLPLPLPAKERKIDTAGAERNIPTVSLPPGMAKEVKHSLNRYGSKGRSSEERSNEKA